MTMKASTHRTNTTSTPSPATPAAADTASDYKPTTHDKALELLHKGVADLMSSDGWREALEFKSKFYQYSFFNTSLILAQHPNATLVAGYRKWQELGRQVRKGEKGIAILAPLFRKLRPDEQGCGSSRLTDEGERMLVGFRSVYVFDVSQTEGELIPEPQRPLLLTEDSSLVGSAVGGLESFAASQELKVSFDLKHPKALGVYRPSTKAIALKPDLPPLQTLKTLIHELAHALLHDLESDRTLAELEAESCAFLVCHGLGLDTSRYSFAYLANWGESLEQLIAAGERASGAASKLLVVLRPEPEPKIVP